MKEICGRKFANLLHIRFKVLVCTEIINRKRKWKVCALHLRGHPKTMLTNGGLYVVPQMSTLLTKPI